MAHSRSMGTLGVIRALPNMADIKIKGYMTPPSVAEARTFVGEVLHVCVGGKIHSSGTPFFDLLRFARVHSVRERTAPDRICLHCGESAQIAFEVIWESEFTDAQATEVCEHCADGRVTDGSDSLTFGLKSVDPILGRTATRHAIALNSPSEASEEFDL
jgi:hypothetical protein